MSGPGIAVAGCTLCLLGAALGVLGLAGWHLDIPRLRTVVAGQPAMMPNTALGLILLGIGGALRRHAGAPRPTRALATIAALVALAIGALTLTQYALQLDLGIDTVLLPPLPAANGPFPGRPSPPTAMAIVLLAVALLVIDVRPGARARPFEWLVFGAAFIAFVALVGATFGAGPLYRLRAAPVIGVAVHTAIGCFMIAAGMLFERPSGRAMRLALSSGPGGILLRRLAPVAVLAPLLLKGLIASLLAGIEIHDQALAVAVQVASVTTLVLSLLLLIAPRLNRAHTALEQSRARTRDIVQHAPDGIFVIDVDGSTQEVNDAGCRMLGYSRGELLHKRFVELAAPVDRERLEQRLHDGIEIAE